MSTKTMRGAPFAIACAFALLAFAGPAYAEDAGATRTVAVSVADLDLTDAQDRRRAERRIARAAREVCGATEGWSHWGPRVMSEVRTCRARATEQGLAQLDQVVMYADVQLNENRWDRPIMFAAAN